MINKIGSIDSLRYISRPTFQAKTSIDVDRTEQEQKDVKAFANYRLADMAMSKKLEIKELLPTILHPDYSHLVDGEYIYTSAGNLHSIIKEDDETKIIYSANSDDDRFFDSIITIDKETGSVVKRQINEVEDGKYEEMTVVEYSKETGKTLYSSQYEDGKLVCKSKTIYNSDGSYEDISYNVEDKEYYLYKTSPTGENYSRICITDDLKFASISKNSRVKNKETYINANFYNGAMISYSEEKEITMPNLVGREPLADKDLIPIEKINPDDYSLEKIKNEFDGEKTFYSNGAIESIKTPEFAVEYEPDGKLMKLVVENRQYNINQNNQKIVEDLGENKEKITEYRKDGSIKIKFVDNGRYKRLSLDEKKKPISYKEGVIDIDGEEDAKLSYYYNDAGVLNRAYSS